MCPWAWGFPGEARTKENLSGKSQSQGRDTAATRDTPRDKERMSLVSFFLPPS